MSSHFPGRLRAGYHFEKDRQHEMIIRAEDIDDQPYVAILTNNGYGNHEENARRIVAAWNACRNLNTEYLERVTFMGNGE